MRALGVLATLGPRVIELAEDESDAHFVAAVRREISEGRRRDTLLQFVSAQIIAALSRAGIPSAGLKGPELGEAIYGEPGRRRSRDVDLLVAEEHLAIAVKVVRDLGYEAPIDQVDSDGLPLLHFALSHERGELPPVELHWRIHWYEREFARARLLPPRTADPGDWLPDPAAQLFALLLFYSRDGLIGLRLAADLAAWWDAFGTMLPPKALDLLATEHPALARAARAAASAAEQLVALPMQRIITPADGSRAREVVAIRLADPSPRRPRAQIYAEVGLVDWLLAPPDQLTELVRRHLLVPREVRLQRTLRAGQKRPVSLHGHALRVVGRYVLAIVRLFRTETLSWLSAWPGCARRPRQVRTFARAARHAADD